MIDACTEAGYDIGNDFIKQMIKMKLSKEDELKILSAVVKRINDYVHHETVASLSK